MDDGFTIEFRYASGEISRVLAYQIDNHLRINGHSVGHRKNALSIDDFLERYYSERIINGTVTQWSTLLAEAVEEQKRRTWSSKAPFHPQPEPLNGLAANPIRKV